MQSEMPLIIEKNGRKIFVSRRSHGIVALLLAGLAHGDDLNGATLICPSVSPAGLRLARILGVAEVRADVKTDGNAPLEQLSVALSDPVEFLRTLRGRLMNVVDHNLIPDDDTLALDLPARIGGGGGGT